MSRKRSRRKKGRNRWSRWIGGGLAVLMVLGVLGLLGAYFWIRNYLRSPEFLELVNTKASETLQAEAEFNPFVWEGFHVRSPLLEVTGDGMIRKLEAEDFQAEVSLGSLLRRRFESSEFHGRSMHVELDLTKPRLILPEKSDSFEFPGLKISSVSGAVDFGTSEWTWSGVGADVQSGSASGSYDIQLGGGKVRTPISLFPEGKLRSLDARFFDGQLYISDAEFGVYESGVLDLNGEVGFSGGEYAMQGNLRRVYCEEIVPEDWKKQMLGVLESEFTVSGSSSKAPVVRGDLVLKDGVLTALPVLDRLAAYTNTSRFRRLVLSDAQLSYTQQGERLELRDIVLESKGLTRVEGRLDIVAGQLDGYFQFGVMPGVMAGIPGAETKVFTPGKEGLLWTPVRITGTLEKPKEDLSKRIIAAAGERMFEMIPETGALVLKHSGRKASKMATGILERLGVIDGGDGSDDGGGLDVIDAGTDILKGGTDAVRNGVGGLFDLIPGRPKPPEPKLPEPEIEPDLPEDLKPDVPEGAE